MNTRRIEISIRKYLVLFSLLLTACPSERNEFTPDVRTNPMAPQDIPAAFQPAEEDLPGNLAMLIETDHPQHQGEFWYSQVWYVDEGGDEDESAVAGNELVRKTCLGLTDLEPQSAMNCESDDYSSMPFDQFEAAFWDKAQENAIALEEIAQFLVRLKDQTLIHKMRSKNIAGENNDLLRSYSQEQQQLAKLMVGIFAEHLKATGQ